MTILTPDRRDTLEFLVTFPGSFERCLQPLGIRRDGGNHDMDLVCSERFLPVFWTAFAVVAQRFCAGHHSLLKLRREGLERRLRYAQHLQALIAQCDAHPSIALR